MDVYSVLALATAATASAQMAELEQDLCEFELAEAPVPSPDAPWAVERQAPGDADGYALEL